VEAEGEGGASLIFRLAKFEHPVQLTLCLSVVSS